MDFFDQSHGVMVTTGKKSYYTTNGGASWSPCINDEMSYYWLVSDCVMTSPTEAWASNLFGQVQRSTDGGRTWSVWNEFGYAAGITCLDMRLGGYGWTLTNQHIWNGVTTVMRFDGYRWMKQTVATYGTLGEFHDVSSVSENDAWAVGKGGLILHLVQNNIDRYTRCSVAQALTKPDGTPVTMTGGVVSASFPGQVYVEATNRGSGLKVLTSQSMAPKTQVRVTGVMGTDGPERVIRYGDLIDVGTYNLKPVGMNTSWVHGTAEDVGLSSIPLLVRICGRVSARDDSGWFTVDDGSKKKDSLGNPGVKVAVSGKTPPAVDTYVTVTGISSFESVGGQTYPLIRARGPDDVQP
jgi:hypothetical protein